MAVQTENATDPIEGRIVVAMYGSMPQDRAVFIAALDVEMGHLRSDLIAEWDKRHPEVD